MCRHTTVIYENYEHKLNVKLHHIHTIHATRCAVSELSTDKLCWKQEQLH